MTVRNNAVVYYQAIDMSGIHALASPALFIAANFSLVDNRAPTRHCVLCVHNICFQACYVIQLILP